MVYILIPIYNEEANIEALALSLLPALPGYKKFYVFVDDGSSDNSKSVIQTNFSSADFIILGDGKNHGPGSSFNTGFEWILQKSDSKDDTIVTMEGDNTSDINILPQMVKISELGFDLVLSSIYAQGGAFDKTSMARKILSLLANTALRFFYGIKIQTLSSFYRVHKIELLRAIKSKYKTIITEKGFICMLELLVKAIRLDAKIIEVPMVLYSKKRKGNSKMKLFKTSVEYFKFVSLKGSRF